MSTLHSDPYAAQVRKVMLRWAIVLVVLAASAFWAAWRMSTAASRLPALGSTPTTPGAGAEPQVEYWTCTMHPQVRMPGPGACPQCSMKLVPKYHGSDEPGVPPATATGVKPAAEPPPERKTWYKCTMPECNDQGSDDPNSRCPVCGMKREAVEMASTPAGAGESEHEITLSQRARRLAELATEPVSHRHLFKRIRTTGKVTYDETRHKMVTAWTSGRIDRLFADYTGMVVKKGDHLVELYSPELIAAQDGLLEAEQNLAAIKDTALDVSRRSAERLVASARQKLELLGITPAQIDELQRSGKATNRLVIHAPLGGTIVRKAAMEGMYVKTGDLLYEIADLTRVWLLLDLYEADLPWVRPFQEVRVTAQSLPGEEFRGQTVFVDPVVDKLTRTIKVRVNVDNPDRRLKPEMFVTAEIEVELGRGAKAMAPKPRGNYACPMHPWEMADARGDCSICGMDLVPVESIPGYSPPGEPGEILSVPREAIMQTGERALAYVQVGPGTYRGLEARVGPLAEGESGRQFYPVLAGLEAGQLVVTRGNFAIDSQMQIAGKPSLFHARGLEPPGGHHQAPVTDTKKSDAPSHHQPGGGHQ